jgi:hypothetical protein
MPPTRPNAIEGSLSMKLFEQLFLTTKKGVKSVGKQLRIQFCEIVGHTRGFRHLADTLGSFGEGVLIYEMLGDGLEVKKIKTL